jgi:hypothetical protein
MRSASRSARLAAKLRDLHEETEAPVAPVTIGDEPEIPLVEQAQDEDEQGAPEEDVTPVMAEPMASHRSRRPRPSFRIASHLQSDLRAEVTPMRSASR